MSFNYIYKIINIVNNKQYIGVRTSKICPYCNLEGAGGNMTRYHFDNCKEKKCQHH